MYLLDKDAQKDVEMPDILVSTTLKDKRSEQYDTWTQNISGTMSDT